MNINDLKNIIVRDNKPKGFPDNHIINKRDIDEGFIHRIITKEIGKEASDYIAEHFDLKKTGNILLSTHFSSYFEKLEEVNAIINLKKVNDIGNLNTYFRSLNCLLPDAGIHIGCAETNWGRKIRIYNKYTFKLTAHLIWAFDFIFNRVLPRLAVFKNIISYLNNHRHKALSTAEVLGRLVYNGFEIVEFSQLSDKLLIFVAIKTGEPLIDKTPSFGPIIKLKRVGKHGKMINVYKFRTMHPYSEYLQDFVLKLYGYNHVGKPANDFRLAQWGKFFRRFYLDEIPQIINLIKGDINLVGVRPLSKIRYNQFPEDIKRLRIKFKPGFIPPYVSLNMPDAEGNIEAERIYIREKEKHPLITDIKYLVMGIVNVITGKTISS